MQLQVELERADWTAFVQFLTKQAWSGVRARRLQFLSMVSLATVIVVIYVLNFNLGSFVIGIYVALVLLYAFSAVQNKGFQPSVDGPVLGRRQLDLSSTGIQETTVHHQTIFYWSTVRDLAVTPKHLFVMIDTNSAFIIPRRCFASEAECDQFQAAVQGYRAAAAA